MALQAFFPKLFFITMRFGGQAPLLLMKSNTCISKLFPRKKVVVVVQKVSHSSGIFRIYYNIAKQHLVANLKGPKFFNGLFHFCFFSSFSMTQYRDVRYWEKTIPVKTLDMRRYLVESLKNSVSYVPCNIN